MEPEQKLWGIPSVVSKGGATSGFVTRRYRSAEAVRTLSRDSENRRLRVKGVAHAAWGTLNSIMPTASADTSRA